VCHFARNRQHKSATNHLKLQLDRATPLLFVFLSKMHSNWSGKWDVMATKALCSRSLVCFVYKYMYVYRKMCPNASLYHVLAVGSSNTFHYLHPAS